MFNNQIKYVFIFSNEWGALNITQLQKFVVDKN